MSLILAKKVINGLMRRIFGINIIKVHYMGRRTSHLATDLDDVVKRLTYEDFLLGDPEEFCPDKLKVIKERLIDNTYIPYGIIENGKLLYSCWISLGKLGLPVVLKHSIRLNNEQGYLEDAYCSIEARGYGLHTKMIAYRLDRLHSLEKKEAIITVIDGNIPALKANLKSGMKDLGVFYCGSFFGRPFCTLTDSKKCQFDSQL